MRLLLDTHVLVWWAEDDLRAEAEVAIVDEANELIVSAATIWEAKIKEVKGKLEVPMDLVSAARERGVSELAITWPHAVEAASLPRHHTDPFDRMLIAQAQIEGLTLVTRDAVFEKYGVALLPA